MVDYKKRFHAFYSLKVLCFSCLCQGELSWKESDRSFNAQSKGKSPKVPFHRNTLSYSYFEFLRQFNKKQNMIKKNYQLNRIEKFVDKAWQCFAFLHIKPKFKFAVQWSWFLETFKSSLITNIFQLPKSS